MGFPKSICTSINEVICHGIPDSTVLKEGDLINLDVTAYLDGVHGDTNATYPSARSTLGRLRSSSARAPPWSAASAPCAPVARSMSSGG